ASTVPASTVPASTVPASTGGPAAPPSPAPVSRRLAPRAPGRRRGQRGTRSTPGARRRRLFPARWPFPVLRSRSPAPSSRSSEPGRPSRDAPVVPRVTTVPLSPSCCRLCGAPVTGMTRGAATPPSRHPGTTLFPALPGRRRLPEGLLEERDLEQHHVLGDGLLRRHVRDPRQRQHRVRVTGRQQGRRQTQGVGDEHVIVGEPVDDEQ